MLNNPGRTISIDNIGSLLGSAYPRAVTPSNIVSGFNAAGITPYNPDVFTDEDFWAAAVTDREVPTTEAEPTDESNSSVMRTALPQNAEANQAPTSALTPELIRPFPKAPPREENGRSRIRTMVVLGTPEKQCSKEISKKKRKRPITPEASDEGSDIPLSKLVDNNSECEVFEEENISPENISVGDHVLIKLCNTMLASWKK